MALLPKGLWFSLLKGKLAEPTLWVWLCYQRAFGFPAAGAGKTEYKGLALLLLPLQQPLVLVFLLLLRSLWFFLRSNSSRKT
jgi:hypothetical protein